MRFAKIDLNQPEIVAALRAVGVSVKSTAALGDGFPDLVASKGAMTWLIEIKGPKGQLTPDQVKFIAAWSGPVHIVRTVDEALKLVGVLE